jgi:hypothetical protein
MKPKYGDVRHDGSVFTGYTKHLTKKYGVRKYAQWRSLESLKKNPLMFKKLIARVEASQNVTQPPNNPMDLIIVIITVIVVTLCLYVAFR